MLLRGHQWRLVLYLLILPSLNKAFIIITLGLCHFSLLESVQAISAAEGSSVFSLQDDKGYTPAHWACFRGHEEIVRLILDSNGPIDKPSNNELGAHPIHWACVNGHVAIVDILLQAGVSVNVVDNKGCTPIIMAAQYGHTVLVSFLMGKGAKPQTVDEDGNNVLHWAVFYGKKQHFYF